MSDFRDQSLGIEDSYAETVGVRLRAVRRQKHLSLQAVEAASGQEFKASVLGAYERGERVIPSRGRRLAHGRGRGPAPARQPGGGGGANGTADPGAARDEDPHRPRASQGDEGARGGGAAALPHQGPARPPGLQRPGVTIRAADLLVIGATFGLGVVEMVERLQSLGLIYATSVPTRACARAWPVSLASTSTFRSAPPAATTAPSRPGGRVRLVSLTLAACITEIRRAGRRAPWRPATTVYVGGGAPSLVARAAHPAPRRHRDPAPGAEVTVEANPESTTGEFLRASGLPA